MGVDRPSRSGEDDGQDGRRERRQPEQKPPDQDEPKQARPLRAEIRQARRDDVAEPDQRGTVTPEAAEAYRARHNAARAAEPRQAIGDRQVQTTAEPGPRGDRSAEARSESAKLDSTSTRPMPRQEYLEQRHRQHDELVARYDKDQADQRHGADRSGHEPAPPADRPRPGDDGPGRPLTRREAEIADATTLGHATPPPEIDPERLAKARADLAAERAARGDTTPEPRPTEAPRNIDGVYRLLAQIHDPHPNATTPKPGDRPDTTSADDRPNSADKAEPPHLGLGEEPDTRTEPHEHAEHQGATAGDAIAHDDRQIGRDEAAASVPASGDELHTCTTERARERADRTNVEPSDGRPADIEVAKGELRAALEAGDDARLVEAARRLTDATVSVPFGDRSPEAPADAVPIEGADNVPLDPWAQRPVREWREGDPPIDPASMKHRDEIIYVRADHVREVLPDGPRLAGPESRPLPEHTPEQKAELVAEGRARGAEVVGKPNWSNAKFAGEVFYEKLTPELKQRFPEGVQFSYEGFPIFDRYAVKTVVFEDGFAPPRPNGRPDRDGDNRRANAIFGWKDDPPGMTWHHVEDGRTMHLVDSKLHDAARHWGGVRASKTGEEKKPDA